QRTASGNPFPTTFKIRIIAIVAGAIGAIAIAHLKQQNRPVLTRPVQAESAIQTQAEDLLQALVRGDSTAADQISEKAPTWLGETHVTNRSDQLLTTAINLPDMHSRQAALDAELALNGIPENQDGFQILATSVGDSSRRPWALWLLGALGNRGVDPEHAGKILGSYLTDPDANTRTWAVNGLALLGTDETITMLLDRFRNDASPVVQERAACGLAESGIYTREQRMTAVQPLISWLEDPRLTTQQRAWDLQALGDITGQHFGTNAAQWRNWYANQG
ncbi:MAG TPA: HEAT repeat domain-containing protein, partial [Terriglobales bacterium]|nr:HEAT repeat domain-containing protein [Terriglobales bacterium]